MKLPTKHWHFIWGSPALECRDRFCIKMSSGAYTRPTTNMNKYSYNYMMGQRDNENPWLVGLACLSMFAGLYLFILILYSF